MPIADRPASIRTARVLICLDSLLFLALGAVAAAGAHPSYPLGSATSRLIAVSSFVVACLLAAFAWLLGRQSRQAFVGAVGLLSVMILASVFDEFGLADLAFAAAMGLPLLLLVRARAWYLRSEAERPYA